MFVQSRTSTRRAAACALAACLTGLWGCATSSPDYRDQRAFQSPEKAAAALAAAAKAGDTASLEAIFGPDARRVLSSGDPVADRRQRQVFAVALDEGWTLEKAEGGTRELIIGHEQWPFPIPLVKDSHGWWFDTAAGEQEVLARRIGRNELAAMGALRAYVFAQREYAADGHDGHPSGIYAQKIRSEPGRQDGLYWEAGPNQKTSPLGEFAAGAAAEGYGAQPVKGPSPYHGYFFRILTRQGKDATGGAKNYIANGYMTQGFAMIAHPAQYGNSGIMTFLVGPDGVVYESDLGEGTAQIAGAINEYSPDKRWSRVD